MVKKVHFNINLLNMMQDEVNFLDLSGGHEYSFFGLECWSGPEQWLRKEDGYGPNKSNARGSLALRLIECFKPRTIDDEAESAFPVPCSYCGDSKSRVVAELFATFRTTYRSYFSVVEHVCSLMEDYDGVRPCGSYEYDWPTYRDASSYGASDG